MKQNYYRVINTPEGEYDIFQKRNFIFWHTWKYVITAENYQEVIDFIRNCEPSPAVEFIVVDYSNQKQS